MALYGVKDIGKSIVRNDIKEIKQMGTFFIFKLIRWLRWEGQHIPFNKILWAISAALMRASHIKCLLEMQHS